MTDKRRAQFLTGVVILNSLLLGLTLFFLLAALGCVSTVLDQESNSRSFPSITEWAVNLRPKDLISTSALIVGVVATSLFAGLSLRGTPNNGTGTLLYFAVHSSLCLLAGAYFLFFVMAVAFSQIHIYGDLYAAGHGPPPRPSMITAPSIDSRFWLAAAVVYSLGLLILGIMLTQRHGEANDSVR